MKKLVLPIVLVLAGVPLHAQDADRVVVNSVHGQGGYLFANGDHGDGYAAFLFDLQRQGPGFTGTLLFAAEYELDFPDIVVELENIQYAKVTERTARFAGIGRLIDEPVFVTALALDRAGTGKRDTFELTLIDMTGVELLHARGELFIGDIQFGEPR